MKIHKNAKTTPLMRAQIHARHARGERTGAIAAALGISRQTACKWIKRGGTGSAEDLQDRSSRPRRLRLRRTGAQEAEVERLRRARQPFWKIACAVGLSRATVARLGRARGLSRLSALDPKPAIVRYEKAAPGEMIHIDIKKLGRIEGVGHRITGDRTGQSSPRGRKEGGKGWEYLHVAIDDRSRLAFTQVLASERKEDATAFLDSSLAYFQTHGITVERVMTDNGAAYKSFAFRDALAAHGIRHKRTRPYRPQTNGKAERFIQTSIREWAYARPFASSAERTAAMHPWLLDYNTARPHAALGGKPPISRLAENNLSRCDI